jgi:hypothetical protein
VPHDVHPEPSQDVQPVVDYAKFMANTGAADHNFRGEGWQYAVLPMDGRTFR